MIHCQSFEFWRTFFAAFLRGDRGLDFQPLRAGTQTSMAEMVVGTLYPCGLHFIEIFPEFLDHPRLSLIDFAKQIVEILQKPLSDC